MHASHLFFLELDAGHFKYRAGIVCDGKLCAIHTLLMFWNIFFHFIYLSLLLILYKITCFKYIGFSLFISSSFGSAHLFICLEASYSDWTSHLYYFVYQLIFASGSIFTRFRASMFLFVSYYDMSCLHSDLFPRWKIYTGVSWSGNNVSFFIFLQLISYRTQLSIGCHALFFWCFFWCKKKLWNELLLL